MNAFLSKPVTRDTLLATVERVVRTPMHQFSPAAASHTFVNLSYSAVLLFVLQSGCPGRLAAGRVERDGDEIRVYDAHGNANEYISGSRLRSWCIVGLDGEPLPGWCSILSEDRRVILPVSVRS
jgi:hypothetical protein